MAMGLTRILSCSALLMGIVCAAGGVTAMPVSAEEPLLRQTLDRHEREERLLHRALDLSEVQCWDGRGQRVAPPVPTPDRIALINLWSVRCEPCRTEFPRLRNIVQAARQQGLKIDFWFIADPPDETSQAEALAFWQQPPVALPDAVACRSTGTRLRSSLGVEGVPISLLVDSRQVIRQAFMGSIEGRKVAAAMERLLALLPTVVRRGAPKPSRHR